MLSVLQEKRPLKRPRLGVPDVYPQEAKQKEDELNPSNVKNGFQSMQQISEEFGTARNCNVTASKVGAYFNAIAAKRQELMTLPDSGRKKQQINPKDNFWPVTVRSKAMLDMWFKDLAGNKPLISLAKKAPSFNKKEEIFTYLCDNQVSMQKAAWFIKLSSAYTTAVSEAKIKKRQMPDPATEWTGTIIKFMKDLIPKLHEHYHQGPTSIESRLSSSTSSLNLGGLTPNASNTVTPPLASPASGNIHSPANNSVSSTPNANSSLGNTSSFTPGSISIVNQAVGFGPEDHKAAQKQWNYCAQLCKYMLEEGLLDRHEFLNWVLDLLDRMRAQPSDDGLLKLFLPLALQYMSDFVQSERLSRRLAYVVCKKLAHMLTTAMETKENAGLTAGNAFDGHGLNKSEIRIKKEIHDNPMTPLSSNAVPPATEDGRIKSDPNALDPAALPPPPPNPLETILNEYLTCPHHHDLILQLSAVLHIITIECPTALVWSSLGGENRASSVLIGSPLDHLPIPPSTLPMPAGCTASNLELRAQLKQAEETIKKRSKHCEMKWCTDKWQNKNSTTNNRILATLDALDNHCFDKMDASSNNNLDALYGKIFPAQVVIKQEQSRPSEQSKDAKTNVYNPKIDEPVVKILCEWAISCQRWGEHRAMAVAWLLDKHSTEVMISDSENGASGDGDRDSNGSGGCFNGGSPIFQNILMAFLDNDAPILEDNANAQNRTKFTNLVHLFSELIRHDVFSHDAYMCTLISRGDLQTVCNTVQAVNISGTSNKPSPHQGGQQHTQSGGSGGMDDDMFPKMEFDDSNVDDDLDKILQNIKEDQAMDVPDSPKIDQHNHGSNGGSSCQSESISRHFLYAKHFPLSQDDPLSQHDCNQRYILLFGVGKERDEKKHAVKKMSKEICKLFSKKFSIDVAEGGKVKKHSRSEFNFESTTSKFQTMSYFDQNVVTWQCAVTVQEMLNSFAMGNSNYLPVQEHVAFLFDLMEMALNIFGLIDMCIQILKELPEVELQLHHKNSLVKSYTTSLSLYVVGVLRRYHSCLLLSLDQTLAVFEGLCKVVKNVTNVADCSSAERCILAYLLDLYSSCSMLKTKSHATDPFQHAYNKIKALFAPLKPEANTHPYNMHFMAEVFANPRRGGKIDPSWSRQLNESAANRYSFVCNALVAVSRETDNDRLNDIAATCAELTASCNSLSAEWLGAFIALCYSKNEAFYSDILTQIDTQNLSIHNSLAVFNCILIARHCFSLEQFMYYVALPALVNACNGGREITAEAEAGARLSCHLLLRLFKTNEIPQPGLYSVSTSPNPITAPGPSCNIKLSCDRHLLAAAHKNIAFCPVLAALKGILLVESATAHHKTPSTYSGIRSGLNTPVHPGSTPKSMGGTIDLSHILGTSDLGMMGDSDEPMLDIPQLNNPNAQNENTTSLSDFAQHVLRQICSQEWVLERCLQNASELCHVLLDAMLTTKQAQQLLHMICYAENESNIKAEMDQKAIIVRILENLEQWSLRISCIDLQLMFKQTTNGSPERSNWLDTVARAAIDVFNVPHSDDEKSANKTAHNDNYSGENAKSSMWLVAPLVSKLPSAIQGRILRVAGQVLETTNFFNSTKKLNDEPNEDSNESNEQMERIKSETPQMSHQAFLGLILTCLKGQDEQKEGLLSSLYSQLSQFLQSVNNVNFQEVGGIQDPSGREEMLDALQLRFSLVGGMFDAIQRNGTATTDWAILLTQLISQSVIDLTSNSELFTTVLDMLTTLIHSTLISDNQSDRDESKKTYTNLMKKLKKELGDKTNASVKYVRQLLPLSKITCEVIACESANSTDAKGGKMSGFNSLDKRRGLSLADKQRVSVWDLLEGHKNPAPLSWAWFGAVKMERRPLAYEETHRLLKYHTHNLVKPRSFFYEAMPMPPEEFDPAPIEKPLLSIKDELKADTPSSVDQSPSSITTVTTGRGRAKNPTKRTKKAKNATAAAQAAAAASAAAQQQQQQAIQPQPQNPPPQMQQQQPPNQPPQIMNMQQQNMQNIQNMQNLQQAQQMGNNPNNPMHMQMNMQNQMNPNMQQQFQQMGNNMPATQLIQQQLQGGGPAGIAAGNMMQAGQINPAVSGIQGTAGMQVPSSMQGPMGAHNPGMGFGQNAGQMIPGGPQAQVPQQPQQQPQQQQWGPGGFNPMQQQQNQPQPQPQQQPNQPQQQAFINQQGMASQMNRFDRPQISSSSKQALHQMLRQRQPPANFGPGNQPTSTPSAPFNTLAAQRQQQQQQAQQQQAQQQFMRVRGMTPGQMGANQMSAAGMGQGNQMMSAAGIGNQGGPGLVGQSGGGMVGQGAGGGMNPNAMMSAQQGGQMGAGQGSIVGMQQPQQQPQQQQSASAAPGLMTPSALQSGAGIISNQQPNPAGMMGQSGMGNNLGMGQGNQQAGMFPGGGGLGGQNQQQQPIQQNQPQQQQFNGQGQNQTFNSGVGGYGNQAMPSQNQQSQQSMNMGNFNQMTPQQREFLAQQRLQQQAAVNRNQFMQQVPNVTMQGNAPPYRQTQGAMGIGGGGKPGMGAQTPQQQQQFRMRQQLLMQHQQQGMGGGQGMVGGPQNPNQGMGSQQTSALVAQLQRQIPNQQNMMGGGQQQQQQYNHPGQQY